MNVLGYLRVSTEEQARSGYGLDAQRDVIEAEAQRKGWTVRYVVDDGYSAKDLNRPGIRSVIADLENGGPKVVVVAKLDRLSRSLTDAANLMDRAQREGWMLVALDLGVDMTTAGGRAFAGMAAVFAQWEREIIGERTKAALAVKKASGARLGRPRETSDVVVRRVVRLRGRGHTLRAIADRLNREGVPTTRGGREWYPATVSKLLRSVALDAEAEAAKTAGKLSVRNQTSVSGKA